MLLGPIVRFSRLFSREYYRPHELTSLDDLYCSNMINSMRDYTPSFAKNISPFAVRDPQEKNAATSASPDQPGFPSSSLKVISTGLPASTGTMNQRPGESMDDGRSSLLKAENKLVRFWLFKLNLV